MKTPKGNIFSILPGQDDPEKENFQDLLVTKNLRIEHIVSKGHITPDGKWYDQEENEWVLLLTGEAKILFDDGEEMKLIPGDHILIPARCRHKVTYTSHKPPAVWLTVFFRK